MKKNSKYIQVIIFLSSFALLGFLLVQLYWAKNTFNDGSRAICIARQSFHIFDTLDVVKQFNAKALGWTKGRSFYRGKQILEFEMPDSENQKYRPMYNLEQQYIEKFLILSANKLIDCKIL